MAAEPSKLFGVVGGPIRLVSFASSDCCEAMNDAVQRLDYEVETVAGDLWLQNRSLCQANTIVLLGNRQPDCSVLAQSLARSRCPQLLAISDGGSATWNEALTGYCQDVVAWPCDSHEFEYRVGRLFNHSRSQSADRGESDEFAERLAALGMVGRSEVFLSTMRELLEFSACDVPILVRGETGTGKELAARAVHASSARATRQFVSINCGALPDNLIENELFGHERGAFTDAREAQQGLVAQAHGGTLFLDEVDTLTPLAQVALLRFLETQEYRPLGGREVRVADTRIVAATNADLYEMVREGSFRRDLLFRLDVCGVLLPPLRERGGDIDLLADFFLSRYAEKYRHEKKSLHPGMIEWMREGQWKGNVRELDNMLHRLVLLTKTPQIFVPQPAPGQSTSGCDLARGIPWRKKSYKEAKNDALENFERNYLAWLMAEAHGNLSLAARKTHLQRSSLRRLLQKHGIDKNAWKTNGA